MFKWKVTGLGGGSKKVKGASSTDGNSKLNNDPDLNNSDSSKPTKKISTTSILTHKKDSKLKEKEVGGDPNSSATSPNPNPKGFRLFSSGSNIVNSSSTSQSNGTTNGILKNYDKDTMCRVGQRLAMTNIPPPAYSPSNNNNTINNNNNNNNVAERLRHNLSTEQIYSETEVHNTSLPNGGLKTILPPPSIPSSKPRWQQATFDDEEAIPNDSLYANQDSKRNGSMSWKDKQFGSRPSLNGMAHWSSHGYLAKSSDNTASTSFENPDPNSGTGYVHVKKHAEQASRQQPQSLPNPLSNQDGDRKYFSVKGFNDMSAKHPQEVETSTKYLSVDARYNSMKNLPPDLRTKLRENLRQVHEQQQHQSQVKSFNPYQTPPAPPNYQMPPAPPPRPSSMKPAQPARQETSQVSTQPPKQPVSNLESSKQMSNSVSWLEWTQQLQAYIAWVNSQLRKRTDLRPVQDLRTDLQSGEVLAQLIEIISGEKIAGIEYNPESIQGMRDNLDRILQFMAAKRIRMHHITSKEILEGNLKAVMRLILALAAHYKPQSVRHHDVSLDNQEKSQPEKPHQQSSGHDAEKSRESFGQTASSVKDKASAMSSPLNRTQESLRSVSSTTTQTLVKRSPSMNENHYSPVTSFKPRVLTNVEDSDMVYENISTGMKASCSTMTQSTEKQAISTQTDKVKPALQKEGSFVRTGSGRKLPIIPDRGKSQTLPNGSSMRLDEEDLLLNSSVDKSDNRKSRPKALEFWETLETVDSNDFRYNTIHRMSMGRRMLPKPPPNNPSDLHQSHVRSLSLDRSVTGNYHDDKESLNSSFSESDKQRSISKDQGSVPPSPRPSVHKKIPPDGCSLQSSSSGGAPVSQPSPPSSSDTRGEVEGSSDNNSPPTSVIQGADHTSESWDGKHRSTNPAFDWIRGAYGTKSTSPNFRTLEEEVNFLRNQRMGDGIINEKLNNSDSNLGVLPYEILIHDLTQAKRQLLELHSLLLTNMVTNGDDNTSKTLSSDEFSECVENINVLNLRLRNADERCNRLRSDLKNSKQECSNLQNNKLGLESRLAEQESNVSQLKQDLLRATLAKQSLEFEKKEMVKRIEELERGLAGVKSENGEKDKLIRAHKIQLEEFSRRSKDSSQEPFDVELKSLYDEELTVAKDAISNLRTSFRDADPSQHILDTLEQCISVIIEKIQKLDFEKVNSSRLNSLEYSRSNEGLPNSPNYMTTKILYFTNRSVTPFMSTINKKIGDISLRDFKTLFDRPGFYRFHFKTVDQEFGMVKEEISNDDSILPGSDGKIVAWVEED